MEHILVKRKRLGFISCYFIDHVTFKKKCIAEKKWIFFVHLFESTARGIPHEKNFFVVF